MKWQINAISYLCYSAEPSMHQKNTHRIWVFVELQTSQLYVSCSAGSSEVQPFCSFLPRKTTHKATRKQKDSSMTSRRQLNGRIQTAREISITPQIRPCFLFSFFSFLLISFFWIPSSFSISLFVVFMPHWFLNCDALKNPFFIPCFSNGSALHLGYPTAPGLFRLTPCCLEVVQSLRDFMRIKFLPNWEKGTPVVWVEGCLNRRYPFSISFLMIFFYKYICWTKNLCVTV